MSEYRFACPVCRQHITLDRLAAGSEVQCPTCFRQIVAPQAPETGDTKLVLSGTVAGESRPTTVQEARKKPRKAVPRWVRMTVSSFSVLALLAAATLAGIWYAGQLAKNQRKAAQTAGMPFSPGEGWTLDLDKAVTSKGEIHGQVNGAEFHPSRVVVRGSTISLRQGPDWPPELGVSIALLPTQLDARTLEVRPSEQPPLPRITLRWKNNGSQPVHYTIRSGYAMKLNVKRSNDNRLQGSIFLALPDEKRSWINGRFEAELGFRKGPEGLAEKPDPGVLTDR